MTTTSTAKCSKRALLDNGRRFANKTALAEPFSHLKQSVCVRYGTAYYALYKVAVGLLKVDLMSIAALCRSTVTQKSSKRAPSLACWFNSVETRTTPKEPKIECQKMLKKFSKNLNIQILHGWPEKTRHHKFPTTNGPEQKRTFSLKADRSPQFVLFIFTLDWTLLRVRSLPTASLGALPTR